MINLSDIAIVLLACKDFESLEISLANYLENTNPCIKFFILQNGRGTYDKKRTYKTALRYRDLYPDRVTVVDKFPEAKPYIAIKRLLDDEQMKNFRYICKVDDDTFPVTKDWIETLAEAYSSNKKNLGESMQFVFPLVNNNPWGFKKTVELLNLKQEYETKIGRVHLAGNDWQSPIPDTSLQLKIYPANEIFDNGWGTIWRYPYIARWIHEKTTFDVDNWIAKLQDKPCEIFDNILRYSINCMLFEKEYWNSIANQGNNDEEAVHINAMRYKQNNVAVLSVPFVHLFFFTHREENSDLIVKLREYYQERLKINYPISICTKKFSENENRLREIENICTKKFSENENRLKEIENILLKLEKPKWKNFIQQIFSVRNNDKTHKVITIFGIKFKFRNKTKLSENKDNE